MLGVHIQGLLVKTGFAVSRVLVAILLLLIRVYQLTLSPFIGNQCRFHPTCSVYAQEALRAHGLRRGGWLAIRRLASCHPFNPGGVDPVPDRVTAAHTSKAPAGAETFKVNSTQC